MLRTLSLIIIMMLMAGAAAQPSAEVMTEIHNGFRRGDARMLARHFGQNLELNIPGSEGTFSHSQSEMILRDFFSKNRVRQYEVNRQGPGRDGSTFTIATLTTRDDQTYRVYFLIKRYGQAYHLHQIQIDLR